MATFAPVAGTRAIQPREEAAQKQNRAVMSTLASMMGIMFAGFADTNPQALREVHALKAKLDFTSIFKLFKISHAYR